MVTSLGDPNHGQQLFALSKMWEVLIYENNMLYGEDYLSKFGVAAGVTGWRAWLVWLKKYLTFLPIPKAVSPFPQPQWAHEVLGLQQRKLWADGRWTQSMFAFLDWLNH